MSVSPNTELSIERKHWNTRFLADYKNSLAGGSLTCVVMCAILGYLLRDHIHFELTFQTFLFFGGLALAVALMAVPHALALQPSYPSEEGLRKSAQLKALYERFREGERSAAASQVNTPASECSSTEKR